VLFCRHGHGVHNQLKDYYEKEMGRGAGSFYRDIGHLGNLALPGDLRFDWTNARLTEQGLNEAGRLNQDMRYQVQLGMPRPTAFFCSSLWRTMQTMNAFDDGLLGGVRPIPLECVQYGAPQQVDL